MTLANTAPWTRSSFCGTNACVEAAPVNGLVLMRDSKHPDQPAIAFGADDWNAFLDEAAAGKWRHL